MGAVCCCSTRRARDRDRPRKPETGVCCFGYHLAARRAEATPDSTSAALRGIGRCRSSEKRGRERRPRCLPRSIGALAAPLLPYNSWSSSWASVSWGFRGTTLPAFAHSARVWSTAMPASRPQWKGYLKLSLVSCPIAIYPAVSAVERISFRQINRNTGNRLRQQFVDAVTGEAVDSSDKGRGYEVGDSSSCLSRTKSLRPHASRLKRSDPVRRRSNRLHRPRSARHLSESLTARADAPPRPCLLPHPSLPGLSSRTRARSTLSGSFRAARSTPGTSRSRTTSHHAMP